MQELNIIFVGGNVGFQALHFFLKLHDIAKGFAIGTAINFRFSLTIGSSFFSLFQRLFFSFQFILQNLLALVVALILRIRGNAWKIGWCRRFGAPRLFCVTSAAGSICVCRSKIEFEFAGP